MRSPSLWTVYYIYEPNLVPTTQKSQTVFWVHIFKPYYAEHFPFAGVQPASGKGISKDT